MRSWRKKMGPGLEEADQDGQDQEQRGQHQQGQRTHTDVHDALQGELPGGHDLRVHLDQRCAEDAGHLHRTGQDIIHVRDHLDAYGGALQLVHDPADVGMLPGVHGDDHFLHLVGVDDLSEFVPLAQARQSHLGQQLIPAVHVHEADETVAGRFPQAFDLLVDRHGPLIPAHQDGIEADDPIMHLAHRPAGEDETEQEGDAEVEQEEGQEACGSSTCSSRPHHRAAARRR